MVEIAFFQAGPEFTVFVTMNGKVQDAGKLQIGFLKIKEIWWKLKMAVREQDEISIPFVMVEGALSSLSVVNIPINNQNPEMNFFLRKKFQRINFQKINFFN
jgi:hypothetical protein